MGCALCYHAVKLYNEYSVGYGIVSCQSKEAKHASVKKDFSLSNHHMSNSKLTINGGRFLGLNI